MQKIKRLLRAAIALLIGMILVLAAFQFAEAQRAAFIVYPLNVEGPMRRGVNTAYFFSEAECRRGMAYWQEEVAREGRLMMGCWEERW